MPACVHARAIGRRSTHHAARTAQEPSCKPERDTCGTKCSTTDCAMLDDLNTSAPIPLHALSPMASIVGLRGISLSAMVTISFEDRKFPYRGQLLSAAIASTNCAAASGEAPAKR